ncbi:uncharacterized protein LOC120701067 [Panicum virgatum]|nr:uncharacterized protein LOC120701067 [Panicum virgatum]
MFRNKNRFLADGEVSVQKVDKIEHVYNLVRRPAVYTNPAAVTVVAKLLPADVAVSDQKMFRGPQGRRRKEPDSPGSFRDNGASEFSESSRRGMASQRNDVADAVAEDPEPLDSRRGGRAVGIDAAGAMGIDAPPELRKDRGKAGGRFPALVHVAIVLVGLVAGKLPAVAFTMFCFMFVRSARRSPPGGRGLARLFPDQA